MSIDPIGPLVVAAKEAVQRAEGVRNQLVQSLQRNHIPESQEPSYGMLDSALWTLQGTLDAYGQGTLAGAITEQAQHLQNALSSVETAAKSAQSAITRLG